jgi:hypothetical protein
MNEDLAREPAKKPWLWKRGQSGNPRGRPKGGLSVALQNQIRAVAARGEYLPLDILLAIARKDVEALKAMGIDPRDCRTHVRTRCAEACLPYTSRRLPIAIEADGPPLLTEERLKALSEDELRTLGLLMRKMRAPMLPSLSQCAAEDATVVEGE